MKRSKRKRSKSRSSEASRPGTAGLKIKKPIAIVVSRFNDDITVGLLNGAIQALEEAGVQVKPNKHVFDAPGAYESPLIAKKLAQSKRFSAVICLGCVIKGDTAHFEFISLGAAVGIQMASLEAGIPIAFGVLTTYTEEQAIVRSQENPENKGREAALAALGSLRTLARIQ